MLNNGDSWKPELVYCQNGHGYNTSGTKEALGEIWEDKVIAWLGWCDKCGARVIWKYPMRNNTNTIDK